MSSKIEEQLAKLLRLAQDGQGATDAERDAAMAAAQRIAFKHAIDLNLVDTDEEREKVEWSELGFMDRWEGELLHAVADVNFCRTFYIKSDGRGIQRHRWCIYGKKTNISATGAMFMYLREQIDRRANHEIARRDKRMQYALITLQSYVKEDLRGTAFMERLVKTYGMQFDMLDAKIVDLEDPEVIEEVSMYLMGNDHLLRGQEGLEFIMRHTGLTASYASEIRPYLRRGEYSPEIVKDLGVWRQSFYRAMIAEIWRRLRDEFDSLVKQAGDNGMSLVKSETAGLDEFGASFNEEEEKKRKWDEKGYVSGTNAAHDVALHNRQGLSNRKALTS